ncbi:hemerythrin domain-containing protein [Propionivibrio sp.]|uniref:hemerythrin domain-containing protein n=1 Tax=Propionivibrio sp. TaxID=2212460 RepID=UPI0025EC85E4|nr:hemerythrin domain-containing protein [Propionivibrio sp.]
MTGKHRQCDDYFVAVEQALARSAWSEADSAFNHFRDAMLQHFALEESILFPAFEAQTGINMGPTQVMRAEHAQMRALLAVAEIALAARDADDYSGNAETLLIMTQQHNMKEENMLYAMCDQHLALQLAELLPQLESGINMRELM